MKEQRAFILPTSILLLSGISFIALFSSYFAIKFSERVSGKIHIETLQRELNTNLISSLVNLQPTSQAAQCTSFKNVRGKVTLAKEICVQTSQQKNINDFVSLMNKISPCPFNKSAPFSETVTGNLLSLQSIVSPLICNTLPEDLSAEILLEGNVELLNPTSIYAKKIFLSGYIYSSSQLILTDDTILISGGDIILNHIGIDPSFKFNLYLHSLTGNISYLTKDSNVTVFCSSKFAICPDGMIDPNLKPNWIPQKSIQTIGIRAN